MFAVKTVAGEIFREKGKILVNSRDTRSVDMFIRRRGEIDFQSPFQEFTIREQLTGGVNPGRREGTPAGVGRWAVRGRVNFLGGRLYRSPVASNDHPGTFFFLLRQR